MSYCTIDCVDKIMFKISLLDLSNIETLNYMKEECLKTLDHTNKAYEEELKENEEENEEETLGITKEDISKEYEPRIRLLETINQFCNEELNRR